MTTPPVRRGRTPVLPSFNPAAQIQRAQIRHVLRSPQVQATLTIGQPNDKYEQEADRVADEVMRMPEPGVQRQIEPEEEEEEEEETLQPKPLANQITPLAQVQRQEEPEEEEETLQAKPLADQITPLVQRQEETPEEEVEEEPVQAKFKDGEMIQCMYPGCEEEMAQRQPMEEDEEELQAKSKAGDVPDVAPAISSGIQSLQGGGRPMSGSERSFFEPRFGADFSGVRVHNDTRAASAAQSISARAFTIGKDVVFGTGEYSPDSSSGRKLFAHELAHVGQQNHDQRSLTPSVTGVRGCSVVQRRVVTPREIRSNVKSGDTNSAEIQGVRESITDTLTEMYSSNKTFVDGLFTPGITTVSQIAPRIAAMGRKALIKIARKIQKKDKSEKFTTRGYKLSVYKHKLKSKIRWHWRKLKHRAIQWIKKARNDSNMLQKVFGDGTVGSPASMTAAATAKANFGKASTALKNTRKILFDSSGISGNLSLGGYAYFPDQEIFMVIGKIGKPTRDEMLTAAHEGMHLADSAIDDDLGYASRAGSGFEEGSIAGKLNNADHYAQVIAHKENVGRKKVLPFKPRAAGAMPATPTTMWDTPKTEALRDEVTTETRELWDATVDGFLESEEKKKAKKRYPDVHVANASKLMNMTLHRPNANYTKISDLDLSLAESTVKRVTALGDEVDKLSRNKSPMVFLYIFTKVPPTFNAVTKKKAAFQILLDVAKNSTKLKPEDKKPTVKKHLAGLRNRKWRSNSAVW